jgi:hypothetical protein
MKVDNEEDVLTLDSMIPVTFQVHLENERICESFKSGQYRAKMRTQFVFVNL